MTITWTGLALAAIAGAASGQTVQMLDTLGGTGSIAHDINDLGVIVGESLTTGDTHFRATRWDGGGATDLGALVGTNSIANAINNNGDVVGYNDDGAGVRTSLLFSGGSVTDLGAAIGAVGNNVAWDINDSGSVVGQAPLSPGFAKGYIWDSVNGGRAEGTIPGYMGGANFGINNAGIMVGHSFFFGDPDTPTIAVPDGFGGYNEFGVNPPGFFFGMATAISDTNIAVGFSNALDGGGDWQAVIFQQDPQNPLLGLGRLPGLSVSEANDVNDSGLVVGYGWGEVDGFIENRAFAWQDGVLFDLNELLDNTRGDGFDVLLRATGVNEHGDIVGFGRTFDGSLRGFVIEGFVVPAPGAGAVLGMGVFVASRRRR